jgi:hypothetical protein
LTQQTLQNQYSNRPPEGEEVQWWRLWLCKIVYGLWHEKRETLAKMQFPPRPVSQREIFREVQRRIAMLKEEGLWGKCKQYPFRVEHNHNYVERRINEIAKTEFGIVDSQGRLKVVCSNSRKGLYEPNPELFSKT